MYIVANGKIYSPVYNEALKMYPELKLVKTCKGNLALRVLSTGVATKPTRRHLATLDEVLAQFGASATVEEVTPAKAKAPSTKSQPKK